MNTATRSPGIDPGLPTLADILDDMYRLQGLIEAADELYEGNRNAGFACINTARPLAGQISAALERLYSKAD